MSRARFITLGTLVFLTAHACYKPHVVDCVIHCDAMGGCASGMSCSEGWCTRGPTCVLAIAAGARHACALRGGAIACWGNNAYGQLGIGSTANRGGDGSAIEFSAPAPGRATIAIAAGGRHTCAIVSDSMGPNTTIGAVQCWGDDSFGQLGSADGRARGVAPGDSADIVPLDGAARAIAAGLTHTCALLADGRVVCWGDNRLGQLGVPQSPAASDGGVAGDAAFAAVDLGEEAKAVAAGAYHTCALLKGHGVRCWGWNDYAQLGDPTLSSSDTRPGSIVTVSLPDAQGATAIAAGAFHSCAILDSGALTCWGQNDAGQLGVGKTSGQLVTAPGNLVALGKGRTANLVAAGASHTCARLDDFSVKCWGFNADGELGIGDTSNRDADVKLGDALPRVALGPDPVSRLAAGSNHTCVVQGAAVKCWGFGDSGRLGVGDGMPRGDESTHAIEPVRLVTSGP